MERDPAKCRGTNREGDPCGRPPMKGATVCKSHGGGAPQVREAAGRRLAAQEIRRTLGDVPDDVDPAQALLELVKLKYAEMHWLRAKVQEVGDHPEQSMYAYDDDKAEEQDSLTWGKTKHVSGTDPETGGMADSTTHESQANVWWRLLREAEDQLAKYSALALKAGVERRQIELQEAQAVHLAGAINRILDALELSAEQQKKVSSVVPKVLRSLVAEEAK